MRGDGCRAFVLDGWMDPAAEPRGERRVQPRTLPAEGARHRPFQPGARVPDGLRRHSTARTLPGRARRPYRLGRPDGGGAGAARGSRPACNGGDRAPPTGPAAPTHRGAGRRAAGRTRDGYAGAPKLPRCGARPARRDGTGSAGHCAGQAQDRTGTTSEDRGEGGEGNLRLTLYVAGQTPKSIAAIRNLERICAEHLRTDSYAIEVVDLCVSPHLAREHNIVAIPTLVRQLPVPIQKVIGDLSDRRRSW